jgi:putative membrane protein
MMPMMYWFGGLNMLLPGLALVILVVAAILAVVVVLDRASTRDDDSANLLRMRYAAGEIDAEEYRRRLTDLRATHGATR